MAIQLDIFEDMSDMAILKRKVDQMADSQEKVRKKQFAELQLLSKICFAQNEKIAELEKLIQGKIEVS
jgi:hypothetical protein